MSEGWGWTAGGRRRHYFVRSKSLCGRFKSDHATFFVPDKVGDATNLRNCVACRKRVADGKAVIEFAKRLPAAPTPPEPTK